MAMHASAGKSRSGRNRNGPTSFSGEQSNRPFQYPFNPTRHTNCPTCGRSPPPLLPTPVHDNRNKSDFSNTFNLVNKLDQMNITNTDTTAINFDAYEDIPVEVTGSDIPKPVTTFSDIDLGQALMDNIVRCKYVKPTPVQRHAIPVVMAGRDLMACAQTGSGKTAAFCFPIISGILKSERRTEPVVVRGGGIVASPLALILSPTRELSCQIHDEAKKFSHHTGVRVSVAYGGAPISQQLRSLEKGVDILVATPGRLVDLIERSRISLGKIKYLALDEADRMLDMGFEPQIRKIVQQMGMPTAGVRQTMLFSATFAMEIQRLASDFLSNYVFLSVGRVGSSTDLIVQKIELVQDMEKRNALMKLLSQQRASGLKNALTVVFVETKRSADSLENWLRSNGFLATAIHGDKVQYERERSLRSFKSGATPIMVATDVASRGLDIPNVAHVINYDLPKSIDDYVHRIGRTGRAGKSGLATAFFSKPANLGLAKPLAELIQEAKQEVPSWLSQYAERSEEFGSGHGRGRGRGHRGGSKFGGRDYRKSDTNFNSHTSSVSANYSATANFDNNFNNINSSVSADYSTTANADYSASANFNSYTSSVSADYSASANADYSAYASVVATGWE